MAQGNSTLNPVSVHQASIQTCSVEIKMVRIGGKQMTLSVFKQAPARQIIDPGVGLRGEPWGLVNYFWDGCGYRRGYPHDHLHVLWVSDGVLCRSCVGRVYWDKGQHGVMSEPKENAVLHAALSLRGDPAGIELVCGSKPSEDLNYHFEYGYIRSVSQDAVDRWRWWNDAYDQLAALDQLYIAV